MTTNEQPRADGRPPFRPRIVSDRGRDAEQLEAALRADMVHSALGHSLAVSDAHALDQSEVDQLGQFGGLARLLFELRAHDEAPGLRLRRHIRAAMTSPGEGVERDENLGQVVEIAAPWPSALAPAGADPISFRGLVIVAGRTGVGKSKLSMRSAMEAAEADPQRWVVYANAELDAATLGLYARQVSRAGREEIARRFPNFEPVEITPAVSLERFAAYICNGLLARPQTSRLLVVLDTVNTIIQKAMHDGRDYFGELHRWGLWAMEARRQTGGDAGFLCVSEMNTAGDPKGKTIANWGDMVLQMEPGDHPDFVRMQLAKDRYFHSRDLGAWRREHATCSFLQPDGSETPADLPDAPAGSDEWWK